MVDPSGFMQYTSSQTTAGPIHRSSMPAQFMVGSPYTMAPIASPQAPQYPAGSHFMFGSYTPPSPPPAPVNSSFKQYQDGCASSRTVAAGTEELHAGYRENHYQTHQIQQDGRSSIKYEPQVATRKCPTPPPPVTSKTVARNAAENAANEVIFHTEIDTLMKAIQLKADVGKAPDSGETAYPSPPQLDEEKFNLRRKSCSPGEAGPVSVRNRRERQKRYVCDFKGCGKRCSQKTQLETHKRAHTGERPFVCPEPGCGLGFSQRGNLKSHRRQHTGEKPYKCEICGKAFAQLGNVKPHRMTHFGTRPFRCIFVGCEKTFTQRGNLKNHHNRFHKDIIRELTLRFKTLAPGETLSDEEQKMFGHFAELYKNLNKGIKGRGKGRKTSPGSRSPTTTPSVSRRYPVQPPPLAQQRQQQHQQHQQHHAYQIRLPSQDGLPCPDDFGDCGVPRNTVTSGVAFPRDRHAAYGQYDMDQASIAASDSATASSSPSTMHEDQYTRTFAGQHRVY